MSIWQYYRDQCFVGFVTAIKYVTTKLAVCDGSVPETLRDLVKARWHKTHFEVCNQNFLSKNRFYLNSI